MRCVLDYLEAMVKANMEIEAKNRMSQSQTFLWGLSTRSQHWASEKWREHGEGEERRNWTLEKKVSWGIEANIQHISTLSKISGY